jgi:uncharacterized protein (TIRG00374 family)
MSEAAAGPRLGWLWKLLFVAAGLGLLAAVFSEVDVDAVWRSAAAVGAWGMAGVLALYLLAFSVDSVSWLLALPTAPVSGRWMWRTWAVRMVGETYNNITPAASMGGEPVKAVLLNRHYGVSFHDSAASLILAKTINMVGLCLFLIVGFWLMMQSGKLATGYKHTAAVGFAALIAATVVFFAVQRLSVSSRAGGWLGRRFLSGRLDAVIDKIRRLDETLVHFYTRHGWRFVGALTLAVINWLLGVVEVYYVLWMLDAPITWTEAWIIEAVAQMVRSGTFFIPLSIGAQEGVFLLIAGAITGQPALGLSVGLVRRFREVIWIAGGYALGVWYTARRRGENA